MKRIHYTCKNCGWTTSIPELWADLRPRKCMGHGCKTVFIKDPSALIVTTPEPDPTPPTETQPASIESFKKKKSKES